MQYYDPNPYPAGRWRVEFLMANSDIPASNPDYLLPPKATVAALTDYQLWVGWVRALNESTEMVGEKTKYVNSETHMSREQERGFNIEFEHFHMAYDIADQTCYGRSVYAMKDLWKFIRNTRYMWMRVLDEIPGYQNYFLKCTHANAYCIPVEPTGFTTALLEGIVPQDPVYEANSLVRGAKKLSLELMCRFPQTLESIE